MGATLPCPFCGRPAKVYGYPWAFVGCEGRDCLLRNAQLGRPNMSVPNAIKWWNKRATNGTTSGCLGTLPDDPIGWCSTHGCYVDHCPMTVSDAKGPQQ